MIDAEPFIRQLEKYQCEYVVIGGLAMVARKRLRAQHQERSGPLLSSHCRQLESNRQRARFKSHPYLRGASPGLPFRFDILTLQGRIEFPF